MKLIVCGHGRHGKDTVCEILKTDYGINFKSSSEFVGKKAVYPYFQNHKPNLYKCWEECFEDRHRYRKLWYDLITDYNTPDLARMGKELFREYDMYCGIRNIEEFRELERQNVFDVSIWVDASERLPMENHTSNTIKETDCNHTIDNNGSLEDLKLNIDALMKYLQIKKVN